MERTGALVAAALLLAGAGRSQPAASVPAPSVAWAYVPNPPPAPAAARPEPADDATPLHVPNTRVTFTRAQLRAAAFAIPDWHPEAHPAMPAIVAQGHKPDVNACGLCHLPTGSGRPENAPITALPRDYFIAQVLAFRDGARTSTDAARAPTQTMIAAARNISDADLAAAADYFTSFPYRPMTRVKEAARVPRTLGKNWTYARDPAGGDEPLGTRIIELADDWDRFERRDAAGTFVAYVPVGSIARGARLARHWGDGQQACTTCHGADLRGSGEIPPLAGRSPTYLARQLNDFHTGARHGGAAETMRAVAAPMRNEDIVALAAFLASRRP